MPPKPPDNLPKYIVEGVLKQSTEELRRLRDWIDNLIEERQLSEQDLEVADDKQLVEIESTGSTCTVVKKVSCGKDRCKKCPGEGHGPYRYEVVSKNGEQVWSYQGPVNNE